MKRLAVFILLLLLLCGMDCFFKRDWNINSFFLNSDVEIYLSTIENLNGGNIIKNGEGAIVCCKFNDLEKYLNSNNVLGFTIKVDEVQIDDVLQNLNPRNISKAMNYTYGYTAQFNQFKCVNGNNFQMAARENSVLVGFPILLGSY